MNTSPKYLSCAETAKMIRGVLKAKFAGVKFSVRSHTYAGGASINIDWTDGPTSAQVDAVVGVFSGAEFDGMIDMKYSKTAWILPNGTVTPGRSPGSIGSGGVDRGFDVVQLDPAAQLVRFGADFIFTGRSLSPEFKATVARSLAAKYCPAAADAWAAAAIERYDDRIFVVSNCTDNEWSLATQIYRHQQELAA